MLSLREDFDALRQGGLEESGKREYPLELPVVWTAMIRVKHGWR